MRPPHRHLMWHRSGARHVFASRRNGCACAGLTTGASGGYAMRMRISFSTGTYYHLPLGYSLQLARDLGYDGVEWVVSPAYLMSGLEPVQAAFRAAGVRALSVHPPFYPFPGWPRHPSRRAARLGALARHLRAELCVIHAALFDSFHSTRAQQFVEAIERGQLAGGPHVAVAVETGQHNRRQSYLLDDLPTLVAYCQEHGCGITFDTCHAGANGEDLLATYTLLKPLLRNIHLSDVIWRRGQPHTHVLPGEGDLPLAEFLATLARDGYDGLVTLEVHPWLAGLFSKAQAERRMGQALEFVRSHTTLVPSSDADMVAGGDLEAHAAEE